MANNGDILLEKESLKKNNFLLSNRKNWTIKKFSTHQDFDPARIMVVIWMLLATRPMVEKHDKYQAREHFYIRDHSNLTIPSGCFKKKKRIFFTTKNKFEKYFHC